MAGRGSVEYLRTQKTRLQSPVVYSFSLSSIYKNLGYAVWLVMLVMAIVFYRERAFFMDAGFQLFNLINEENIQIYHHRFVTAVPQIPVYLLFLFEVPLTGLAVAFSASYILLFLFIYHLLVHYLKNIEMGWVLICLFTLLSLDSFYHMQSEFYLGLSLLLLSFGLVLHDVTFERKWAVLLQVVLLSSVAFSHKLTVVFFVFIWLFFLLNKEELRHWKYVAFILFFLFITGVKSVYFTNWYEAAKQVGFRNNFNEYFPHFYKIPSNLVFLKRCLQYYYMLPVLLVVVSLFYSFKQKWFKIFLVWAFTLGFILLYNISDTQASHRFYSEVSYLPLSVFVAIPFLFDVVPFLAKKINWLPVLFLLIMSLRLYSIADNSQVFKNNFNWIEKQLGRSEELNTNRFLMTQEKVPTDTVLMEWGVPFTSMHLSAEKDPGAAKTLLIMPDFSWYKDKMKERDLFFSPFHKVFKNEELNNKYYDLKPGLYLEIE